MVGDDQGYQPFLPSSLLTRNNDEKTGTFDHNFKNFGLKGGVVINTYDIEDELNQSKITPEYDIVVIEQDGDRGTTSTIYKNCITLDAFGSIPDFFEFKRRQPTNEEFKSDLDSGKQDGSFVLMMCMDGMSEKGIIIGGLTHPKRAKSLTKEAGTHMEGEFNGLNVQINKDGEFLIKFKSASDNLGKYSDEEAGGSYLKIDKTGSIEVSDGSTEFIKIDKAAKAINVEAAKDISVKAKENISIEATKNASMKMLDLVLEASGKAEIKIVKAMNLEIGKDAKIKAKQLQVTVDSICKFQANSFQINSPTILLGAGALPAVTSLTKFRGTGFAGTPVISTAMGPFSSKVSIAV